MRLLRFRLRTLMILVAVVAFLITGDTWLRKTWEQSRPLRLQASFHAEQERFNLGLAADSEQIASFARSPKWAARGWKPDDVARWVESRKNYRARAAYHKSLKRKYEWASFYPWMAVPPDPPPPRGMRLFEDWEMLDRLNGSNTN